MLAYVNGEFVPDEEATISVRDRGFMLGDGVYDVWRTYGGRTVRGVVERNLDRLRRSLNYIELPGDEMVTQIDEATTELVARNGDVIEAVGDIWMFTFVSRGVGYEGFEHSEPTIVSLCNPIPFAQAASLDFYKTGVSLTSSLMPRNPFLPVDPRVKSMSRLAYLRAQMKQMRTGPGNWVVLFDNEGNIAEAVAASLCLVEGDTIVHAPRHTMLPSVNLELFCECGERLGFEVKERFLTMYDYLNADEVYVLSTPYGAYPVNDLDGAPVKRAGRVGPQVMKAWEEYVEFPFTTQVHRAGTAGQTA